MSTKSTSEIFTSIFRDDAWRGKSKSGPGSTLAATAVLRAALPGAFQALGIRTLMDAPCGTAEWVTEVTGDLDTYIGCDVVEELVWAAARDNTRRNHFFTLADITLAILPRADAILCRDCLVHMPLEMAATTIANFRASGSRYLLTTTFPGWPENVEARLGTWRPLDLEKPPFRFPPPVMLLRDRVPVPNDRYSSKSIGIWRLEDLH